MLKKMSLLLSRYPQEPGLRPQSFSGMRKNPLRGVARSLLSFQSVRDKFYFLLFGAIRANLEAHGAVISEVVIVQSINGAVGTGWKAAIKRSAPVAWLWTNPWVRAYDELIDGVAYRCASWAHPLNDLADWFRSGPLWRQLQQQGEDLSLKIDGIEVADLLVDSYLRFKPSPEFDVKDPFVRRLVWQALRDVRQAHAYFGRRKPRWYLTSYTTYLEHGIPARVALRHGVAVWSFGSLNGFAKRLTQADSFHTQNFDGYKSGFDALDRQDERLQQARDQLENRLSGGIDAATSYMRQSAYAQSGVELPAGLDGAVVVFLHDFYDSPHVYPELVFHDFWRWICCTVDVLQKSGARFFLKPHPNQIALSDEALSRLRQKYPDLQWLPASVSNVQLAQAGISCGVTVYGTVAHELAYLGVPSITSARHPHYTFDFCRTARTREEYKGMLESHGLMPLPREEMQRQALAFYYMHNLYGEEDQQTLRRAFVDFWKACNVGEITEESVMQGFRGLVRLPAFKRFIDAMAKSDAAVG
ncbi:hypothetical protein RQP54_19635 [Curvibacter sp. APW13]|uniref:hypothetical protein n=1 Tax=Curvibacter sp. APW13 TaxID=3077236 RepID=UPI0028DE744D|nr:hypothetical protein [Curvibacter sp. APW13]MDT8993095.1 hypothetical protein [Curvibacter sp. APW13]